MNLFYMIGTKYMRIENGKLHVYRITRIKESQKKYILREEKNYNNVLSLTEDDLNRDYIRLNPDAYINFMITERDGVADDVYGVLHRIDTGDTKTPDLIIRQNTPSFEKNFFAMDPFTVYVGDCITRDTCTTENITDIFEFESIRFTTTICIYITDTIDDIIDCMGKRAKKIDYALMSISDRYKDKTSISGYCSSLKELMETNQFIIKYRSIHHIYYLDDVILKENTKVISNRLVILDDEQCKKIQDLLQKFVVIQCVIPYDKDVDLKSIVDIPHIMITDRDDKIYLIAYEIIEDYPIDSNGHDDVMNAMMNL